MTRPRCSEQISTGVGLVRCALWGGHGHEDIPCKTQATVDLEARLLVSQQREVAEAQTARDFPSSDQDREAARTGRLLELVERMAKESGRLFMFRTVGVPIEPSAPSLYVIELSSPGVYWFSGPGHYVGGPSPLDRALHDTIEWLEIQQVVSAEHGETRTEPTT